MVQRTRRVAPRTFMMRGRQRSLGRTERELWRLLLLASFWDLPVFSPFIGSPGQCEHRHLEVPKQEVLCHVSCTTRDCQWLLQRFRVYTRMVQLLIWLGCLWGSCFFRWITRNWHCPAITLSCFLFMWQISRWREGSQPPSTEQSALMHFHNCLDHIPVRWVTMPLSLKQYKPR